MFKDRSDAGKKLAELLIKYKDKNPVVLALPRGGVVVGYGVAKALNSPLDVIISKKIGSPNNPEYGIGAVSEKNSFFIDEANYKLLNLKKDQVDILVKLKSEEIDSGIKLFRKGRNLMVKGKIVILVDDGLATGVTAIAAIKALKRMLAKKVIYASPVCDKKTAKHLETNFVSVICLEYPNISAIGEHYENFEQVEDDKVLELLKKARRVV